MISIFGSVWLTEYTPKILLYLKPKSEPENEFTVKVYKAGNKDDAGEKGEAKSELGEVKFTDVNLNLSAVADYDILKKVSEQWTSVTKIHVTSFSNGSNFEGTIENPLKPGQKSYGVRGLRLEIELAGEPKKVEDRRF
ncbi:hypothetical protein Ddc_14167 [Ditylenchus destructor]|nr:hypothetical protein Ddc_14167 [Ditylenchus destructor]